ncbi:MAG: hypothetical protein L0271_22465, partial [Gemmatimonadetes bacterium]|nr:hypothetical protein [Gemmatimonadota bacterium]
MSLLCVTGFRDAQEAERAGLELVRLVPRIAVEADARRVWADVRGLPREELARTAVARLREQAVREARGGTADTPIAAWAAATRAKTGGVGCVEPG